MLQRSKWHLISTFTLSENKGGVIYLQTRTTPTGRFDSVKGFNIANLDSVIDYDFTALVYPKTIRIVSEVEPTLAEITFS